MAYRLQVRAALHRRIAAAQLALAAIGLALCLLMPRSGGAILLWPVGTRQAGALAAFAPGQHVAVLRGGFLSRGLLVRADGAVPVWRLLRMGVVPIGAPAFLCRAEDRPGPMEPDHHG